MKVQDNMVRESQDGKDSSVYKRDLVQPDHATLILMDALYLTTLSNQFKSEVQSDFMFFKSMKPNGQI